MPIHDFQPPRPARKSAVLDYKDLATLVRYVNPQGQINGRKRTEFNAQTQRDLKAAIKRARHLALLPFVG
jgi:small subunit ribosomal protein S18